MNPDFVRNGLNLAGIYQDRGAFKEALQSYEGILQYERSRLGEKDVRVARDYNNLGICTYLESQTIIDASKRQEMCASALEQYKRAESVFRQFPTAQSQLLYCLQSQQLAYQEMGDRDRAQQLREQVEKTLDSWRHAGVSAEVHMG